MQLGATLGLLWGHNDAQSLVGKHKNYGEPRARMQLRATLGMLWGHNDAQCLVGSIILR